MVTTINKADVLDYINTLPRYLRNFHILQNTPEPKFYEETSEKIDYIKLEELMQGDIIKVKGGKHSHPSANYLIQIAGEGERRMQRLWNRNRGPCCFEGNFEMISYFDNERNIVEFGALKAGPGITSTWPYFVVYSTGLQKPNEVWMDNVGEMLLQRKVAI